MSVSKCKKCGQTWSGLSMAHCAGCCRLFSTVPNFDKHRVPSRGEKPGTCKDPARIKDASGDPVFKQNPRGVWVGAGTRPEKDEE